MRTCKAECKFLIPKMQSQIPVLTVVDQSSKFKIKSSEYRDQTIRLKCLSPTPVDWKDADGHSTIYLHIGNPNSNSFTAETVEKGNL